MEKVSQAALSRHLRGFDCPDCSFKQCSDSSCHILMPYLANQVTTNEQY